MTKDMIIAEDELAYHSRSRNGECLSSHNLAVFRKSPYKYLAIIKGEKEKEENQAFAFGRAAHKLICEGDDAFNRAYEISDGPINPKTGLPYGKTTRAFLDWESSVGKPVVCEEEFNVLKKMQISCLANPAFGMIRHDDIVAEGVVRAEVEGVMCQIRMDMFSEISGIIDLKTCRDIEFFEKDCRDFGYAFQLSFYQMVLNEACGIRFPCHLVAVEKNDDPISCVWDIPQAELDKCERINRAAIRRLIECRRTENYPTGYEQARVFTMEKIYG